MKRAVFVISLVLIIFISLGIIFSLNNSSYSNPTNNVQLNLSSHASPPDFKKAIESGKYKLIDIRTLAEYNAGHLERASQADFYQTKDFNTYLDSLDKNASYLIYCHTGNRSGQALQIMKEKGFANVSDLQGGINAWDSYGYPVVK